MTASTVSASIGCSIANWARRSCWVAVAAPRHLRYKRLSRRPVRPLSAEGGEARERDILEIEHLEKGGPIAMADFTLLNDKTSEELLRQLDNLLDRLSFEP